MSLYRKLKKKPQLFLATTGMTLQRFEELLPQFQHAFDEQEKQRKSRLVKTAAPRQRRAGAGPHYRCDLPEQVLMLLLYYRLYLTQEFMTLLFDVEHKSTICRAIARVRSVFEAVLPLPERALDTVVTLAEKETKRRSGNLGDFRRNYPELTILIDGTEQAKQRPEDKDKRKSDYSGKKKQHTLKQIVTTTPSGLILDQSPARGGRCHDFRVFREHVQEGGGVLYERLAPLRVVAYADSGFTGIEKLSLPVETRLVERARRGHPLTPKQKVLNRVRSRVRIQVEHAIGQRKKYRIASQRYRNGEAVYDSTMQVVAGLVNLRVYDRLASATGVDLLHVGC